jgi:hypothetical protein
MLSLPAIFNTTIETVPARVPYLLTDPVLVEYWHSELARAIDCGGKSPEEASKHERRGKPFTIGVAWQGNPSHRLDSWRSFPLKALAPLAAVPGVRLVNLQVEHGLNQLDAAETGLPVLDLLGTRKRDFVETAALMTQLDLVITPDTAVAHLAGGLGVRVWVALCSVGDWRYPHGRTDTPWYPTMRLFRQSRLGVWEGVFNEMKTVLEAELITSVDRSSSALS